jgi:hypothetical protein
MRLSSLIRQLPISLLISVLVVSAGAIALRDDGIPQLTSVDSFETQDPLLVEFYLPTCPHCQHFAPKWKSLFDSKSTLHGVRIAQVDCSLSLGMQQQP